ncbi:hypothetical protein LIA77_07027 [Sarocladium implicatum]|nr:hypothetical protein LIA77_07027 [Sarocladium implicatum]
MTPLTICKLYTWNAPRRYENHPCFLKAWRSEAVLIGTCILHQSPTPTPRTSSGWLPFSPQVPVDPLTSNQMPLLTTRSAETSAVHRPLGPLFRCFCRLAQVSSGTRCNLQRRQTL